MVAGGQFVRLLHKREAVGQVIAWIREHERPAIVRCLGGEALGGHLVPRHAPAPAVMLRRGGREVDFQFKCPRCSALIRQHDVKQHAVFVIRHSHRSLDANVSGTRAPQYLVGKPARLVQHGRLAINQEPAGVAGHRNGREAQFADGQRIAENLCGAAQIIDGRQAADLGGILPVAGQFIQRRNRAGRRRNWLRRPYAG